MTGAPGFTPTRKPLGSTALLVPALAGAASLLVLPSQREVWLDETHSAYFASMSLPDMMHYVKGDVHPPLYFILLNLWTTALGESPTSLRLLSALLHALGGVAFCHLCIRCLGSRTVALYGAILFTLSPALLFHAGEARMYSLGVLLTVVLLNATLAAGQRDASPHPFLVLGAASAAAVYTHYVLTLVVLGAFLCLAYWRAHSMASLQGVMYGALLCALLVLPWVSVVQQQRETRLAQRGVLAASAHDPAALTFGAPPPSPVTATLRVRIALENLASIAGVLPTKSPLLTLLLGVPILAGIAALLLDRREGRVQLTLLLASVTVATVVGTWLLGLESRRYLLWLAPVALVALLAGLMALRARLGDRAGMALAGFVGFIYMIGAARVIAATPYQPFADTARYIGAGARASDLVLTSAAYAQVPLDYHLRLRQIQVRTAGFPTPIAEWWESQPFKGWGGPIILRSDLQATVENVVTVTRSEGLVWLVLYESSTYDPFGALPQALASNQELRVARCPVVTRPGPLQDLLVIASLTSTRFPADCEPIR